MARCVLHPGRESVVDFFGKNYCALCKTGIDSARSSVDKHVEPKGCFIWYVSNDNWKPISGTGCAHWVSHQMDVHVGGAGACCLQGFTYRVPALVHSLTKVTDRSDVSVDDVWASPTLDHTGIVIKVTPPEKPATETAITIRHDSSRQGRVAENDFATYFHGHGDFYR